MKNRAIPFGYRIADGIPAVHDTEAELVRMVFSRYISGESYSQIASILQASGIPYSDGSKPWNKNMVGRILQNRRYLGNETLPQLIVTEDFDSASCLQRDKYTRKDIRIGSEILVLKGKIRCGSCGRPYHRRVDSRVGERWACTHEGCTPAEKVKDAYLMSRITAILNLAIEDPTQLKIPPDGTSYVSLEVIRLSNEINRELEKTKCDEESVKALILARAAAQYVTCPDETQRRTAKELRTVFTGHARLKEFEPELFEQAVETVFIQPDGTVSLKLRNGQVLHGIEERGESICRQQNA